MNIYLQLTEAFNQGRLRAVICSGQAVVLHRLAIMSKDGDWIVREDEEALSHILKILENYGAVYRFGAPLDVRWLRGGWSSHFEFPYEGIRVRTDFFSRPPRLDDADLERLWREQEGREPPFVAARDLALIKMTQREKDYPVIGELARLLTEQRDRLLFSRSANDLIGMCRETPELAEKLMAERPLLREALVPDADSERVWGLLDEERRRLIRADAERMRRYEITSAQWRENWTRVRKKIDGLPLDAAHPILSEEASRCLPTIPAP